MKGLLLPVIIAFFGLFTPENLIAQPTLTAANIGYLPGQEFILAENGAGFNFFISPQIGANQIWNFSTANSSNYDTIRTLSRSLAPFPALAPQANLVVYSNNTRYNFSSKYRYLEINSSKATHVSEISSITNNLVSYIENPDVLRFPLGYNSSYIDTATYHYLGANNITCTYKQIYTVEAVGYGQLNTPVATYNQALQVRITVESLSDNCLPQLTKGFYNDIIYLWYVPGIHNPVYQIAEHNISLGSIYSGYYLHTTRLGFKEEAASVNLQTFPNPATSQVTIQYKLNTPAVVQIVLIDALGKEVLKYAPEKQSAGNKTQRLDISKLPAGIYLARLETNAGVAAKRLVLQ